MKEKSKEEDMKAPSIEEKAKAYDEALSVAQETYTTQPMYRDWLTKMFPELKEFEDENTRKELIDFHKNAIEHLELQERIDNEWEIGQHKNFLAWLEKQGEQKETPCDKCKKEQPSHSCQDITELGRCALEKQNEQILANSTKNCEDEQKPTDKVEPIDEYEGLTDFERAVADACIGFIDKDLVGWKQYVKDSADDLLKIAVKKFHAVQPKPVWSEDDEGICRAIINDIANDKSMCAFDISKGICDKKINWLKSLKDRVQPQPKQEWSVEDESIALGIEQIVDCASLLNIAPDKLYKIRNWLKSLKNRITWKPSDEQMKMLENVRKILHTNKDIYSKANNLMYNFEELIRTLKKLREE